MIYGSVYPLFAGCYFLFSFVDFGFAVLLLLQLIFLAGLKIISRCALLDLQFSLTLFVPTVQDF